MAAKRERDIYAAGHQRRVFNQNVANKNRKSTDTRANSGKTINRPAQTAKPVQQKRTVYYRSKDDAQPVYKNPAKQKTVSRPRYTGKGRTTPKLSGWYAQPKQAAQPKPKLKKEWGVDFWSDIYREQRARRSEDYTPEYRIKDESPVERLAADAAPGSGYRTRKWINSRVRDYQEDRGSTLAQAKRLASLYQAVDPITKGYTREQAGDLHRQIQNAPVNLQELFIKYGDKLEPMVDARLEGESGGAFYNPTDGRVYGVPEEIAQDSHSNLPYTAHWHEYGHNLDWLAGENGYKYHPSYTYYQDRGRDGGQNLGDLVLSDAERSLRDYWAKVMLNETPFDPQNALNEFGNSMRYAGRYARGLSDMMGQYGLKHGGNTSPIVAGHDADYWDSSGYQSQEAFADMTAASVLGGNSQRYIQAVLPNTYDAYLDMLEDMTSDDPYSRQNTHPQYESTRKKRWPF